MLELLLLLPLIMVSILTMTFQVSVDELSNASRGHYFQYDEGDRYKSLQEKVIYLNLVVAESGSDPMPDCVTVAVEKHLKCGCSCTVTENDCSPGQAFNPSLCSRRSDGAKGCQSSGKNWDAAACPPTVSQICSTGAFFHPELCRCITVDKSGGSRRWKPPV